MSDGTETETTDGDGDGERWSTPIRPCPWGCVRANESTRETGDGIDGMNEWMDGWMDDFGFWILD